MLFPKYKTGSRRERKENTRKDLEDKFTRERIRFTQASWVILFTINLITAYNNLDLLRAGRANGGPSIVGS